VNFEVKILNFFTVEIILKSTGTAPKTLEAGILFRAWKGSGTIYRGILFSASPSKASDRFWF